MNINRSNYEVYFLDYLDGNLAGDQVDDFLDFLKNNPDLHQELKEVSAVKLTAGTQVFQNKEALRKNNFAGASTFDYQSVAYLEGDLSEDDRDTFLGELTRDPEKEKQFDLFLNTKLQPDKKLVFPNKKSLYRKSTIKIFLLWGSRVAALLILLFGIWSIWNMPSETKIEVQYTEEKPVSLPQQIDRESLPLEGLTEKSAPTEKKLVAQRDGAIGQVVPNIQKQPPVTGPELAVEREEALHRIEPLLAKVETDLEEKPLTLAAMGDYEIDKSTDYLTVDEYLAQRILNKSKGEPLSFSNFINAGLEAVSNVSNDRLAYETNRSGGVAEISLNTRILAFSIPLKKDK